MSTWMMARGPLTPPECTPVQGPAGTAKVTALPPGSRTPLSSAPEKVFRRGTGRPQVATLEAIRADEGLTVKVAEAIVSLGIRQFELERGWLEELRRALRPARPTAARP